MGGPKLVKKDSSDLTMCHYSPDMVQINDMNTEEVTIAINNVWTQDVLPTQMRVFIHTDGVDAISKGGEGFKCKDEEGTDIDIEGDNEFTVQCYQTGPDEPFFAVIDVVITDNFICATNDVPHPCNPDGLPILESCSWRIVIPCDYDQMCTDPPTVAPSELPSDGPSMEPSELPSDGPSMEPSSIPTAGPTASPSESHSFLPSDGPSLTPTESHSALPSDGPSLTPSMMIVTEPPIITNGEDDDEVPTFLPPMENDCPEDIILIDHIGVTPYQEDSVVILSQDTTSVTVALQQMYTSPEENIDYVFYNYHTDLFNMKCYEEENVPGRNTIEITIECSRNSDRSPRVLGRRRSQEGCAARGRQRRNSRVLPPRCSRGNSRYQVLHRNQVRHALSRRYFIISTEYYGLHECEGLLLVKKLRASLKCLFKVVGLSFVESFYSEKYYILLKFT